jgi:hypothetical protein
MQGPLVLVMSWQQGHEGGQRTLASKVVATCRRRMRPLAGSVGRNETGQRGYPSEVSC